MPELTDAEWLRAVAETLETTCCGCGATRMRGIADALAQTEPTVSGARTASKVGDSDDVVGGSGKAYVKGLRHAADTIDSPCGEDDEPHGMTCAWRGSKVYHQEGCNREDADVLREMADEVESRTPTTPDHAEPTAETEPSAASALSNAAQTEPVREAAERVCLTAEPITEQQGDETVVVGYRHQTGAMHALIGVLGLSMPKLAASPGGEPPTADRECAVSLDATDAQGVNIACEKIAADQSGVNACDCEPEVERCQYCACYGAAAAMLAAAKDSSTPTADRDAGERLDGWAYVDEGRTVMIAGLSKDLAQDAVRLQFGPAYPGRSEGLPCTIILHTALTSQPTADREVFRWAVWNPGNGNVHDTYKSEDAARWGREAIGDGNPYVVIPLYSSPPPAAPLADASREPTGHRSTLAHCDGCKTVRLWCFECDSQCCGCPSCRCACASHEEATDV